MNLAEKRAALISQVNAINDESTLEMLSETLSFYTHSRGGDITDGLNDDQLKQLMQAMEEPADKDTISEQEFKKMFARWNTK